MIRRILNEDFFDEVEPEDYNEEVEDIDGGDNDSPLEKNSKFVLRIKYNMHNDKAPNMHTGSYVYNVRRMADKMRRCVELLDLFKRYYIGNVELEDPNNENYHMGVNMTFDKPEPEEFDLYKHWDEKRWSSFMPAFVFNVYFDECINLSFRGFCDKIYMMRNLIRTRVCEFTRDGISYEFLNNTGDKKTISYEITGWFHEGGLERIYNELYNKTGDDRENPSTRFDSYMDSVWRKNPLDKIVDMSVKCAKQKYDIELTPHFIQKPDYNGRRMRRSYPFVTFDLNKKSGSIDVKEIEECLLDCFFNKLSMDYFYFMFPVAIVRPLCKVTNNDPTPVRNKDYHKFFMGTRRQCLVSDYHNGQKKAMWRLRECAYGNYGSGHNFFIAITDKKGLIMRDHSNFRSGGYGVSGLSDFVKDEMTDSKIWK